MSTEQKADSGARVVVENIGGIEDAAVDLSPGLTILAGRNATNRTSFLRAIMAACESDHASLKADADYGKALLLIDGRKYVREFRRRGDTVVSEGDTYLDDPTIADQFAFLLETNEARQAVATGDDLREIMLRPIDTNRIETEIDALERERASISDRLDELDALERRLPELEAETQDLSQEIDDLEQELEAATEAVEDLEADLGRLREEQVEHEEALEELVDTRNELQTVRARIDSETESIEALEQEREELTEELDEYDPVPDDRLSAIEDEMQTIRARIQEIERTVDEVGSIIQFNEDMLSDSQHALPDALESDQTAEAITDQLVSTGDRITCWTCGSDVDTTEVEETLSHLRSLRTDLLDRRSELEDDLEEQKNAKLELSEQNRQHEQITTSLEQIDDEIERRQERIADLEDRADALADEVADLEGQLEESESDEYDEVVEVHEERNRLEFELEEHRDEREKIEAEIEEIEVELEQREQLEAEREECNEQLTDLRTRIEQLETDAIEAFNEHMESILALLEYSNLERVWIERKAYDGRSTGTPESRFDLHVVRSTDGGRVYEDTVDHLSESEREVTGLVFALAGYLVHDVYEELPFLLLDSIEAIDAGRIARLVEYIASYPEYLVVALLEADAAAIEVEHDVIESI